MDTLNFVVQSISAGFLSEAAKDAYVNVRDYLKNKMELGKVVDLLEDRPEGRSEQNLLAERLVEINALNDSEFCEKVSILVARLKEVSDVPLSASVLIQHVKSNEATFRKLLTEGCGTIAIRNIEVGNLRVERVTAKS